MARAAAAACRAKQVLREFPCESPPRDGIAIHPALGLKEHAIEKRPGAAPGRRVFKSAPPGARWAAAPRTSPELHALVRRQVHLVARLHVERRVPSGDS